MQLKEPAVNSPSTYVQIQGKLAPAFGTNDLSVGGVIDWLVKNEYEKEAIKLQSCGSKVVRLECSKGHQKLVRITCHKEFCPRCGQTDSLAHKKRYHRTLDRLLWSDILGYVVFTLPKVISEAMPGRKQLGEMEKKAAGIIKENFSSPGYMARFHLMGNKQGALHIHINILFPVVDTNGTGKVAQEILDNVRKEWTDYINTTFNLSSESTNVFYKFATTEIKKRHIASYVTRPIITTKKFLSLEDKGRSYVLSLQGWHNTRWYGKLANNKYKEFLENKGIDYEKHSNEDIALSKVCPACKERFKFVDIIEVADIFESQFRRKTNDVWVDLEVACALSEGEPSEKLSTGYPHPKKS